MIDKSKIGITIADWLINIKNGYNEDTVIGPFKFNRHGGSTINVHYIGDYILYRFKDKVVPVDRILVGQYDLANPESLDNLYDDMSKFPSERLDVCFTERTIDESKDGDDEYSWASRCELDLHYLIRNKKPRKEQPIYVNFQAKPGDNLYLLTIRHISGDTFGHGSGRFIFVEVYKTYEEALVTSKAIEKYYSISYNRRTRVDNVEITEEYNNAIAMADPLSKYGNNSTPDLTMWGESFTDVQIDRLEVRSE